MSLDYQESFKKNLHVIESDDSRIAVGRCTYGAPRFLLWDSTERIEIGSFCSIADDVTIFGGGEHVSTWVTTFPLRIGFGSAMAYKDGHPATKGPTRIGNGVWIGYRSIILSGVTVADGAIVGAGSVVTANVPAYTISAGNPARMIRTRFSERQIEAQLSIRWRDWPLESIYDAVPLLCSEAVDDFIRDAQSAELGNQQRRE